MRASNVARILLAGAAAAVIGAPAFAQSVEQVNAEAADQPAADEATAAADDEGQDSASSEIVVTARRTEERLQRVPASVSAFNERALDRIQATDTVGLQGAVPNLNIVQGRGSSNATNIYIRGVGQPDALQTFDPAAASMSTTLFLAHPRHATRPAESSGSRSCADRKARCMAKTIGGAFKVVPQARAGPARQPTWRSARSTRSKARGRYRAADRYGVGGFASSGNARRLRKGEANDRRYHDRDTLRRAARSLSRRRSLRSTLPRLFARTCPLMLGSRSQPEDVFLRICRDGKP